jgi:hypothetical protein
LRVPASGAVLAGERISSARRATSGSASCSHAWPAACASAAGGRMAS